MTTRIRKEFAIVASPHVLERFERFLALLHHNSNFGHSGLFAMPLDGDGSEKISIEPIPKFANEVELISGVGGGVEIAHNDCYIVQDTNTCSNSYIIKPVAALFKDGRFIRCSPSTLQPVTEIDESEIDTEPRAVLWECERD